MELLWVCCSNDLAKMMKRFAIPKVHIISTRGEGKFFIVLPVVAEGRHM